MIMMHSDDKGLVLPSRAAPIQVIIVPILFEKTKEKLLEKCSEIKKSLKGLRVELDSREEYNPGYKYNEWEMKGVPIRVEFGPKDMEKGHAVLVRRDTGAKEFVKLDELAHKIKETLEDIHKNLYLKAEKMMQENIKEASDWKEFLKIIDDKMMAKAAFCNDKKCEEELKDKSGGAKSMNMPFHSKLHKARKCISCGKEANVIALFAKSY
jgi:prolyl-tRNA synthetase